MFCEHPGDAIVRLKIEKAGQGRYFMLVSAVRGATETQN